MSLIKYRGNTSWRSWRPRQEFRSYSKWLYLNIILKCVCTKTAHVAAHTVCLEKSYLFTSSYNGHCISINAGQHYVTFWEAMLYLRAPLILPVHFLMSTAHMPAYYLHKRESRWMWFKELLKWFTSCFHHMKNNIQSKATQLGEA